ncbi:MAG: hypothetical protein JXR31_06675 [Prolixibacteraceae bacterium]|nr:hypothetical protein [Prolixibacteraceae bacterium]MBN2773915.1 hypothetical protein [Prolixibacteraceae bacterium]
MKFNFFKNNLHTIPKKVREQQKIIFPKSLNIEWSNSEKYFEAVFYLDETEQIARYSTDGKLVEHKKNLWPEKLPKIITEACKKFGEVMNAIEIFKDGNHVFEIIIRDKNFSRHLLLFYNDGTLLKNYPLDS